MVDCNKCENKGRANGLSQETFCESCIHGEPWKKDYFVEKQIVFFEDESNADEH